MNPFAHFIPHESNGYHPHFFRLPSVISYATFTILIKGIVVVCALAIPFQAYLSTDVLSAEEKKIALFTNQFREKSGVAKVTNDRRLAESARRKSGDMAAHSYFSHTSPEGKSIGDWLANSTYPYRVAGENLGLGYVSAQEVFRAWIESPRHRANLLDPDYTAIGVSLEKGRYDGTETVFSVQHFAAPIRNTFPTSHNPRITVRAAPADPLGHAKKSVLGEKIERYSRAQAIFPSLGIFTVSRIIFVGLFALTAVSFALLVTIRMRQQSSEAFTFALSLLGIQLFCLIS